MSQLKQRIKNFILSDSSSFELPDEDFNTVRNEVYSLSPFLQYHGGQERLHHLNVGYLNMVTPCVMKGYCMGNECFCHRRR
jgi:hypothetical protein